MISTVYITNKSTNCDYTIQENIDTASCTHYLLRLNPNISPKGPFEVTVVTGTAFQTYTGITLTELKNGIDLPINCP